MTTYCETLPIFVVDYHPTAMYHQILNFDRNHLKERFQLTSTQCDAIYRLLYVYSTGFFDNVAEWLKRTNDVVTDTVLTKPRSRDRNRDHNNTDDGTPDVVHFDVILEYMARLYCKMMETVAISHYKSQVQVVDAATMLELETYQLTQQKIIEQLQFTKHNINNKITSKTKKLSVMKTQTVSLKDKVTALKTSAANYDSAVSDFRAILKTQRSESERLYFRIHDYKAEAQQLKDKEYKLNVLIPIDEQNQNVLWKALSKLKVDIESVVKERKEWIQKLKGIEKEHEIMADSEYKVDNQLSGQHALNHGERTKKQKSLQRMDELQRLADDGEGVITEIQREIEKLKSDKRERAYHLDEVRVNVERISEEYDALEYTLKTQKNEHFSVENRVESMNQNIRTIFVTIEKTEKSKLDQETKFKVVERQKRLGAHSIDKLNVDLGAINDELNLLKKQNQIREHQFQLSKKKLRKNGKEIDAMNAEEKMLKSSLFSRKLQHQDVVAEVEKKEDALETQNVHFENDERIFDHRIEYELERYSTLEGRLSAFRTEIDQKQYTLSDCTESIEETQETIVMTTRKSEAVQSQIDSLLQQIHKRRQKIWKLDTLREIKKNKLQMMRRQSATKTDSVDHVFDAIDKIKKKYNLDLNELSRSIWSLQENQSQKAKQLQRIDHVMKALESEHSTRIKSLGDEFEKSKNTLNHRIEEEQHRRKCFTETMTMYNVEAERLNKQSKDIHDVLIHDQREMESFTKRNKSLRNTLSKYVSPNTVQDKKDKISKMEHQIKELMVKIQKAKARKTALKKKTLTVDSRGIQVGSGTIEEGASSASSLPLSPSRRRIALITALRDDSVEISSSERSLSASPMPGGSHREGGRRGSQAGLGLNYVPMYQPEDGEQDVDVEEAAIAQALSMDHQSSFDDLAELTSNLWKHRMKVTKPKVYARKVPKKRKKSSSSRRKMTIPKAPTLSARAPTFKLTDKLQNVDWSKAFSKDSDPEPEPKSDSPPTTSDRTESATMDSDLHWRETSFDSATANEQTKKKISIMRTNSMGHKAAVYVPFPNKIIVAKEKKVVREPSRPNSRASTSSSKRGAMSADDVIKTARIASLFARQRSTLS